MTFNFDQAFLGSLVLIAGIWFAIAHKWAGWKGELLLCLFGVGLVLMNFVGVIIGKYVFGILNNPVQDLLLKTSSLGEGGMLAGYVLILRSMLWMTAMVVTGVMKSLF